MMMRCFRCKRGTDTQGEMLPMTVCVPCDQATLKILETAVQWRDLMEATEQALCGEERDLYAAVEAHERIIR